MELCGEHLKGAEWMERAGGEKGMKETLKDETNVTSLCRSRHLKFAFIHIVMEFFSYFEHRPYFFNRIKKLPDTVKHWIKVLSWYYL